MIKACRNCGKEFNVKPSHADKRFCCSRQCMSEECRTRRKGEANPNFRKTNEKQCKHCGNTFKDYNQKREQQFCTAKCRWEYNRPQKIVSPGRARKPVEAKPNPPTKICEVCHEPFQAPRMGRRKYCELCSYPVDACIICGSLFKHHRGIIKVTCSDECSIKYLALRQQGEKSHLWKGGKTSEALIFRCSFTYTHWRADVFKRDDYVCQLCHQTGGKLSAHHIKRFAEHRELALDIENGITLCWTCHASIRHKEGAYEEQFYAITTKH